MGHQGHSSAFFFTGIVPDENLIKGTNPTVDNISRQNPGQTIGMSEMLIRIQRKSHG